MTQPTPDSTTALPEWTRCYAQAAITALCEVDAEFRLRVIAAALTQAPITKALLIKEAERRVKQEGYGFEPVPRRFKIKVWQSIPVMRTYEVTALTEQEAVESVVRKCDERGLPLTLLESEDLDSSDILTHEITAIDDVDVYEQPTPKYLHTDVEAIRCLALNSDD